MSNVQLFGAICVHKMFVYLCHTWEGWRKHRNQMVRCCSIAECMCTGYEERRNSKEAICRITPTSANFPISFVIELLLRLWNTWVKSRRLLPHIIKQMPHYSTSRPQQLLRVPIYPSYYSVCFAFHSFVSDTLSICFHYTCPFSNFFSTPRAYIVNNARIHW